MDLTGEYRIAAPRETVWKALNDPDILKQCIPGCESVEKLSDTEFKANIVLQIGPMKAKFSGKGTLSDLDPPKAYTISGEGQGGVAGFGKGGAKVELVEDGGATVLKYKADAQVGGKIAQLGSRLVEATSRKLADEFFSRFAAAVTAAEPQASAGAVEATPAVPAAAPASGGGLKPAVWIPILIAVIALLLWWFARS